MACMLLCELAAALNRIWFETDVRGVLPSVHVPTLLMVHGEREGGVAEANAIADLMPAAEVRTMPGDAWTAEELLDWVDEIQQADTAGVEPTSHVSRDTQIWRDDELTPSLERDDVLGSAPDADFKDGLFRVPRVL